MYMTVFEYLCTCTHHRIFSDTFCNFIYVMSYTLYICTLQNLNVSARVHTGCSQGTQSWFQWLYWKEPSSRQDWDLKIAIALSCSVSQCSAVINLLFLGPPIMLPEFQQGLDKAICHDFWIDWHLVQLQYGQLVNYALGNLVRYNSGQLLNYN